MRGSLERWAIRSAAGEPQPFEFRRDPASPNAADGPLIGHLTLNVSEVSPTDLQRASPGSQARDAFGVPIDRERRYFKTNLDIPVDTLRREISAKVPFIPLSLAGGSRSETTASYVIPKGSVLPAEFVANINQQVHAMQLTIAPNRPENAADYHFDEALTRSFPKLFGAPVPESWIKTSAEDKRGVLVVTSNPGQEEPTIALEVRFHESELLPLVLPWFTNPSDPLHPAQPRFPFSNQPFSRVPGVPNLFGTFTNNKQHHESLKLRWHLVPATGIPHGIPGVLTFGKTELVFYAIRPGDKVGPGDWARPGVNTWTPPEKAAPAYPPVGMTVEMPLWLQDTMSRSINTIPVGGQRSIRLLLEGRLPQANETQTDLISQFLKNKLPALKDQQPLSAADRDGLVELFAVTMPATTEPPRPLSPHGAEAYRAVTEAGDTWTPEAAEAVERYLDMAKRAPDPELQRAADEFSGTLPAGQPTSGEPITPSETETFWRLLFADIDSRETGEFPRGPKLPLNPPLAAFEHYPSQRRMRELQERIAEERRR
jgi:hypothetical protein